MEMVDVVDKNNQVIGRISKKEAHEKGLLHRCIIAEVINSNNCNLLVKQSADWQEPGLYVSPLGGHIRAGESEEKALARELEEELGYK